MYVNIAGFNIEKSLIDSLKADNATPEVISAAYARISRSQKDLTILRKEALTQLVKARKSNNSIVFEMGHSSIAEHCVFNIDITNVSRLLSETIQQSRLASFTEKSQRYVSLDKDYLIPEEIKNTKLEKKYNIVIQKQFNLYKKFFEKIKEHLSSLGYDSKKLSEKAKEDARYILPLCTKTQMGMTINAKSLQRLLKRLDKCPLIEADNLKNELEKKVKEIVPSLLRYNKADDFEKNNIFLPSFSLKKTKNEKVKLLFASDNLEELILSAGLFHSGNDFMQILKEVKNFSLSEKQKYFKQIFENCKFYNTMPRFFEFGDLIFEISCSSSCFAQLKRHRMASIVSSSYLIEMGNVIPQLVKEVDNQNEMKELIELTNSLYLEMQKEKQGLGNYILTNSHKKNILLKMNFREAYHFSRLRSDKHAQWEIQEISKTMDKILIKKFPIVASLLKGKSEME